MSAELSDAERSHLVEVLVADAWVGHDEVLTIYDVRAMVDAVATSVERIIDARRADPRAERDRLAAQVAAVEALADSMERENPKPGPGGFLAEQIRAALATGAAEGCDERG